MRREKLEISQVQDSELPGVLNFIDRVAFERYGCAPPPPPQFLFTGKRGGKISGTIALDFGDSLHPLPLELTYSFDRSEFPENWERGHFAQYGRWIATLPSLSFVLGYTATIFAWSHEKRYGWFEAKPAVAARLRELRIRLYSITSARLDLETIPESGRAYYLAPPPPQMFVLSIVQAIGILRPQIESLLAEGSLAFDPNLFRIHESLR